MEILMKRLAVLTAILVLAQAGATFAQGPSPDRFFGFMDRNKDGRIDGDEMERMPSSVKDAMKNMRVDTRRGISQQQFADIFPKLMEQMRAARERGDSYGGAPSRGSSGSDRGGSSYSRGGYDRGSSDRGSYDRGSSDRGSYDRGSSSRSGSDRSRSSSSDRYGRSSSRTPAKKEKQRITVPLPSSYTEIDKNKDGQISLFEWDRAKFNEFFSKDSNGDGILTPRELSTPAATTTTTASSRTTSTRSSTSYSPAARSAVIKAPASASSSSSGPVQAVEFDEKSSEGRWAKYVFTSLDRNKDGSLTAEEWNRSQRTRRSFEKHGVSPSFPTDQKKFGGWVVAVMRKEKKR